MGDTIENIEGRRVERSDIVLVEPLPPSESAPTSGKIFRARVVRLAGRPFLIQMTPEEFTTKHNFRLMSLLQNCRARRVGDIYEVNRTRHV